MEQYFRRSRTFFAYHPEWWAWLFSGIVWSFFILNGSCFHFTGNMQSNPLVLCLPHGAAMGELSGGNLLREISLWEFLVQHVVSGIVPWGLMVFAMMFPLLRRSIRHVAFSVRRKDIDWGILLFLTGYTFVWLAIGTVFLALPAFIKSVTPNDFPFYLVAGILFFLAAFLSRLPNRRVVMMKCEWTVPICLDGWKFVRDLILYGMQIAKACFRMCWVVMLSLSFCDHALWLMLVCSLVIVTERYLVPHESWFTAFSWSTIGLSLIVLQFIG